MNPTFVSGKPALLFGTMLVISDTHVGIEYEYRKKGIKMPSHTSSLEKELFSLLKTSRAKTLLICGDFKHKVPGITYQEEREIPRLLERLQRKVQVEIIQGNHDADLAPLLPPGIILHPPEGTLKEGVYFTHGHAWPSTTVKGASLVIMGHVQPQIEIKSPLGYTWREQVWVHAAANKEKIKERYSLKKLKILILPAFNPLAGGLALNTMQKKYNERLSPLLKLTDLAKARIYLLDGTDLGNLGNL